jgi:PAS domain S-box-containing protein
MIDLHETQRIKEKLIANPEAFESIIERTHLGICITDPSGNYSAVNDAYCSLYGYHREELIGKSFLVVVQEQQKDRLQELHDMFMKLKDEIFRNWEVVKKDGTLIKISADAGYAADILGKPHKVTFVWPEDVVNQEILLADFRLRTASR